MSDSHPDLESIFRSVCSALSKQGQVSDLSKEFATMRTDEARVRFLLTLEAAQLPVISGARQLKEAVRSEKLRAAGNECYRRGRDHDALELYTQAVLWAPRNIADSFEEDFSTTSDTEQCLAMAYANRSAALLNLGHLGPCLADIRRALQHKYPSKFYHKLKQRLTRIEQESSSSELESLLPTDWSTRITECQKLDPEELSGTAPVHPWYRSGRFAVLPLPMLKDASDVITSASSSVQISYDQEKGRHLTATRDIEPGEVLVVERPYSSVLLPEHEKQHCHHCCQWTPAPLPCPCCTQVRFCSELCREKAWQNYHQVECPLWSRLKSLDSGQMSMLAVRSVVETGWTELTTVFGILPHRHAKETLYRSDDFVRLRQLEGHAEDRSPADLFKRTIMATVLGQLLLDSSLVPPEDAASSDIHRRKETLVALSAELLRLLQTLPCNAHEVCEQILPLDIDGGTRGAVTRQVGAATYPLLSLTNHSCDPNAFRSYHGTTAVLRALRRIAEGQELLDNYGYHYAITSRGERRAALLKQYYFTCQCGACTVDMPMYASIPSGLAGCSQCDVISCRCDARADVERAAARMQKIVLQVLDGSGREVRELLGGDMKFLESRVKLPWKPINDAQEAFKMCFLIDGNVCPEDNSNVL